MDDTEENETQHIPEVSLSSPLPLTSFIGMPVTTQSKPNPSQEIATENARTLTTTLPMDTNRLQKFLSFKSILGLRSYCKSVNII